MTALDICKLTNVAPLNLEQTFECGQCFRWNKNPDDSYTGIVEGFIITLKMQGNDLLVWGLSEEETQKILVPYLALDEDYAAFQGLFAKSEVLGRAVDYAPGIRVLRQNPWEALCTFVISQNNNIKRIKGIVDNLCKNFGEEIAPGQYSFPTAQRLAACTIEDLAPLRSGFRARYIIDAATRVANGSINLEELYTMPIHDAENKLMEITGVGIKVTHCTLLYGLHRIECLPVDVWMKRAMAAMFPDGLPEEMLPYAGIAQQYIFNYARAHADEL